ncbi:MAG: hypothetical protein L0I24_22940 [Pseudonocardia sp.]|nr:hypothetical protein [Pseudonocardia sp.]
MRDAEGHVADRLLEVACDYCGPPGTWWQWRHNGNSGCWLDIDGIGPFTEMED